MSDTVVWTVTIIGVLIVFAVMQLAMTRSHRRRIDEHDRRMDKIYGIKRKDNE